MKKAPKSGALESKTFCCPLGAGCYLLVFFFGAAFFFALAAFLVALFID
jgi:hypothetical protein